MQNLEVGTLIMLNGKYMTGVGIITEQRGLDHPWPWVLSFLDSYDHENGHFRERTVINLEDLQTGRAIPLGNVWRLPGENEVRKKIGLRIGEQ